MSRNDDTQSRAAWRVPSRRALLLLAFVVANSFAINFALPRLPFQPQQVTTLDYSEAFVDRMAHGDSWKAMRTALFYTDYANEANTDEARVKPLYTAVYFENNVRFQYPPSSLLVLAGLRAVFGDAAIQDPVLNGISWWCIVLLVPLLIRIFYLARRRFEPEHEIERSDEMVYAGVIVLATLTFYPIVRGYYLGQIQVWIDLLITGVVWAWLEDRRGVAGALLAAICVIKPTLAIVVVWGALRRQWDFIIGFAIPMALASIVALASYGLANHLDYLDVLSYISRQGEVFHPNQSMNGLLHRWFENGNSLEWERNTLVTYHPWVHAGTVASTLVLIGLALLAARVRSSSRGALELAIVVMCSTLAAPTVWTHHYGVTLPLFAMALPAVLSLSRTGTRSLQLLVALALAYALISNNFRVLNRLAESPLDFLQSYVYFGGLALLGLLWAVRTRDGESVPISSRNF